MGGGGRAGVREGELPTSSFFWDLSTEASPREHWGDPHSARGAHTLLVSAAQPNSVVGPEHLCPCSRGLIDQWSPTFLAPGTGFMEDNFSMDWVGRGGKGTQEAELRW